MQGNAIGAQSPVTGRSDGNKGDMKSARRFKEKGAMAEEMVGQSGRRSPRRDTAIFMSIRAPTAPPPKLRASADYVGPPLNNRGVQTRGACFGVGSLGRADGAIAGGSSMEDLEEAG